MADIVNGKTYDRKKDLYNHVSFSELYGYNPVISTIIEMSKTVFTRYIEKGVAALLREEETPSGPNANKLVCVPIEQPRTEELGDPTDIYFSMIQIVEPYDIVSTSEQRDNYVARLMQYVSIGLYPLVSEVLSEDEIYSCFEKYDDCAPGREIVGTIVDARIIHGKCFALVMWDPTIGGGMQMLDVYRTRRGDLRMVDMVKTPRVWVDDNATSEVNFGIPVYQYTPMTMMVANIREVEGFTDIINEAVVTGSITLDFVQHILTQFNESMHQLVETAANRTTDAPEEQSIPEDVPLIDAAETDEFGHRMRLYDDDGMFYNYDDEDDEPHF